MCGVVFDGIADLDALVLGIYWASRRTHFPKRSLQPALGDTPSVPIGMFPMRALLKSSDDQFVVQLQHDRFFMNWRSVGAEYPRLSDRHGPGGLLVRALDEYRQYEDFVESQTGAKPTPIRIELTKVNMLRRGEHWVDLDDLAQLLPVTGVFKSIHRSESREVNLHFVERSSTDAVFVHIATMIERNVPAVVRLELRAAAPATDDLKTAFLKSNRTLDEAFFSLIPSDELHRFQRRGEP